MKAIKEDLKSRANTIRQSKRELRDAQRMGGSATPWIRHHELYRKQREYRHRHIAYCLLRGRTYEQIESKCREDNRPNLERVEKLLAEFRAQLGVRDAA